MKLVQKWKQETDDAIKEFTSKVYPTIIENGDEDFIKVAQTITGSDKNPWEFMPKGWEGSKSNASSYRNFINVLYHNMIDDGNCCFVQVRNNVYLSFRDENDTFSIMKDLSQIYGSHQEFELVEINDFVKSFV